MEVNYTTGVPCLSTVEAGFPLTGISVRSSNILKLNAFTLTNSAQAASVVRKMLVDDILVARQRPSGL